MESVGRALPGRPEAGQRVRARWAGVTLAETKPAAASIRDLVAFWHGAVVAAVPDDGRRSAPEPGG